MVTANTPLNYQSLIDDYRKQLADANAANQKRLQQIVGNLDANGNPVDGATGLLGSIGATAKSRVQESSTKAAGVADQDLISRGLGNTTIRSSVQRGIQTDENRAMQDIDNAVAQQKAGVLERVSEPGPDMGLYANLLRGIGSGQGQLAGQAQYRSGGGAGGAGGSLADSLRSMFGTSAAPGGSGNTAELMGPLGGAGGGVGGAGGAGGGMNLYGSLTGNGATATTVTGGYNPADAGVAGSSFDNLFVGQPVYGDAPDGNMGTYAGGGSMNDMSLMTNDGKLATSRFSPSASAPSDPNFDHEGFTKALAKAYASASSPDLVDVQSIRNQFYR